MKSNENIWEYYSDYGEPNDEVIKQNILEFLDNECLGCPVNITDEWHY